MWSVLSSTEFSSFPFSLVFKTLQWCVLYTDCVDLFSFTHVAILWTLLIYNCMSSSPGKISCIMSVVISSPLLFPVISFFFFLFCKLLFDLFLFYFCSLCLELLLIWYNTWSTDPLILLFLSFSFCFYFIFCPSNDFFFAILFLVSKTYFLFSNYYFFTAQFLFY